MLLFSYILIFLPTGISLSSIPFLFQTVSKDKVRLSGYGVELAVKNTEYKAVDDSKIQSGDDNTVNKENEEENDIDGFLFGKLRYFYTYYLKHEQQCFIRYKDTRRSQVSLGLLIKHALRMF
jgi:hypothetical protein